jgi:hypothetical protein
MITGAASKKALTGESTCEDSGLDRSLNARLEVIQAQL